MPFRNGRDRDDVVRETITGMNGVVVENDFRDGMMDIIEKANVAPRTLTVNGVAANKNTDGNDRWDANVPAGDQRITRLLEEGDSRPGDCIGVEDGELVPITPPPSIEIEFPDPTVTSVVTPGMTPIRSRTPIVSGAWDVQFFPHDWFMTGQGKAVNIVAVGDPYGSIPGHEASNPGAPAIIFNATRRSIGADPSFFNWDNTGITRASEYLTRFYPGGSIGFTSTRSGNSSRDLTGFNVSANAIANGSATFVMYYGVNTRILPNFGSRERYQFTAGDTRSQPYLTLAMLILDPRSRSFRAYDFTKYGLPFRNRNALDRTAPRGDPMAEAGLRAIHAFNAIDPDTGLFTGEDRSLRNVENVDDFRVDRYTGETNNALNVAGTYLWNRADDETGEFLRAEEADYLRWHAPRPTITYPIIGMTQGATQTVTFDNEGIVRNGFDAAIPVVTVEPTGTDTTASVGDLRRFNNSFYIYTASGWIRS